MASFPSRCQEVGWRPGEGIGHRARPDCDSGAAVALSAAGEAVALGFGSAVSVAAADGFGSAVAVAAAVGFGAGVELATGVAGFGGSMVGTRISGEGGSSSARDT